MREAVIKCKVAILLILSTAGRKCVPDFEVLIGPLPSHQCGAYVCPAVLSTAYRSALQAVLFIATHRRKVIAETAFRCEWNLSGIVLRVGSNRFCWRRRGNAAELCDITPNWSPSLKMNRA
jgi:hypothetical protein